MSSNNNNSFNCTVFDVEVSGNDQLMAVAVCTTEFPSGKVLSSLEIVLPFDEAKILKADKFWMQNEGSVNYMVELRKKQRDKALETWKKTEQKGSSFTDEEFEKLQVTTLHEWFENMWQNKKGTMVLGCSNILLDAVQLSSVFKKHGLRKALNPKDQTYYPILSISDYVKGALASIKYDQINPDTKQLTKTLNQLHKNKNVQLYYRITNYTKSPLHTPLYDVLNTTNLYFNTLNYQVYNTIRVQCLEQAMVDVYGEHYY